MSNQNGSRLDVSTVTNVVNGVINALALQPSQSSVQGAYLLDASYTIFSYMVETNSLV